MTTFFLSQRTFLLIGAISILSANGGVHAHDFDQANQTNSSNQSPNQSSKLTFNESPKVIAQLNEVVVTANRVPEKTSSLAAHISVITSEEIAKMPAQSVQGVLSGLAGVRVAGSLGASDSASIDLRGFGATGSGNTLVLIDGIKQNPNDSSSPYLGVVPLSEIERIEVVRGSGAVQYGSGATGGVINIITKTGFQAKETFNFSTGFGMNRWLQNNIAAHFKNDSLALDLYARELHDNNERINDRERNHDLGASLAFRYDSGDARFYARNSEKYLEISGARAINPKAGLDEYNNDRYGSSNVGDHANTKTQTYGFQWRQELFDGILYADLAQLHKETKANFKGWQDARYLDERDLIENTASLRFEQTWNRHRVVLGADASRSKMPVSQGNNVAIASTKIRQHRDGFFVDGLFVPWENGNLTLGARTQRANDQSQSLENTPENPQNGYEIKKNLKAWQLGLRQTLNQNWSVYGKLGQSFRLANSDEQAFVIKPLEPQISRDAEIGVIWQQDKSSLRGTFFRYNINNELMYNPLNFANVNLDPTRRQGLEIEGLRAINSKVKINSNLTWQQARFVSGQMGFVSLVGKTVPLVPTWMANIGANWQLLETTGWMFNAQYVSRQRLDNDQTNEFNEQLPAYTIFNTKITHRVNSHWEAALEVNNLLDKHFATYGIRSGSSGASGLYSLLPAMGREARVLLTVRY